jgi:inorganic pyrophosphatase
MMTKAEIIAQTLGSINLNDEQEYQTIVIAEFQRKLPEGVDIKTCEDCEHLGVECCDTCHNFYPHYELRPARGDQFSPA